MKSISKEDNNQVSLLGSKKKFRRPVVKKEEKVQMAVCKYLRMAYPKVIFTCDLASGMRLPIHIAAKNKAMRSSRGLPDLFIAKSNLYWSQSIICAGLFIEIKTESVFLKDGVTLKQDKHIQEQNAILVELRQQGYKAEFGCGFDHCKKIIDEYMSG